MANAYLQFVQQLEPRLELERLASQASRYFDANLRPVGDASRSDQAKVSMTTALGSSVFTLHARRADPHDYQRLPRAELANDSHGMAALGQRCGCVWEVVPEPGVSASACLHFGALLASIALGPLLPPDDSGLFGVRSARLLSRRLETSEPAS
jgi:hypothetical protein